MRFLTATAAAGLAFFATQAQAATVFVPTVLDIPVGQSVSGPITSDHCSGGCLTNQTSGGTVTITNDGGGTYDVHVALANNNEFIAVGGFDVQVGFDLTSNPTITYTALTAGWNVKNGTPTTSPPSTQASTAYTQMDGFGTVHYGVLCTVCGNGGSNPFPGPLDFTITGATTFQTFADNNGSPTFMVFDIISGTTGLTGLTDVNHFNAPVPGPIVGAGLPGLMVACGGLLALGRRRRQKIV